MPAPDGDVKPFRHSPPSPRQNLIANGLGAVLTSLIQMAVVPVYMRMLGPEAYGLIGIQTTLQMLAQLLDFGVSALVNRELARRSTTEGNASGIRDFVRTLEVAYALVGLGVGALVFLAAPGVERWVQSDTISPETVRWSVRLIALYIFAQWPFTFYQGALLGLQKHRLLNTIRVLSMATTAIGAVAVLSQISRTTIALFAWQSLMALAQVGALRWATWRHLPGTSAPARVTRDSVRGLWRFAANMTGVTATALLLSNLDRIVLSHVVPLATFGYYMLAVTVSNALLYTCGGPVFASVFPRLSALAAVGDSDATTLAYRRGWAVMAIVIVPAAAAIALFAAPLIRVWTRDAGAADVAGPVAAILVAGTALNALLSIPLALQLAQGWAGLALRINVVLCALAIVGVPLAANTFGITGAATAWLTVNITYAVVSIVATHRRWRHGPGAGAVATGVFVPAAAAVAAAFGARLLVSRIFDGAAPAIVGAGITWLAAAVVLVAISPILRGELQRLLRDRRLLGAHA